ncbi:MAG TPA: hypothetical protein VFL42_03410, partial [Terriglobales bacterium]|nr:hypothetical protein [Terriglobales bacterium]
ASVAVNGGMLFQRFGEPPPQEAVVSESGMVAYKGELPKPELWYLPTCRFAEGLELLDFFGFPCEYRYGIEPVCADPESARQVCKSLLLDLAAHRTLAFEKIALEAVVVEHFGGEAFSSSEIDRVLAINRERFGRNYKQAELKDLRSHYRKSGFFVLGAC